MATKWFVRTDFGERGPLTFQDVAFLIRDNQVSRDGLVRREDLDEWQPANSVVGLVHAARRHQAIDEKVVAENEEIIVLTDAERRRKERQEIFRKTQESLMDVSSGGIDERTPMEKFLVWGPIVLILAAGAYAGWIISTHDPFEHKNFEQIESSESSQASQTVSRESIC